MAASFVVDASVLVEFLAPGEHGAAASRLIGALGWPTPVELHAPDLILLETASALRKLVTRRETTAQAADDAIGVLRDLAIATVPSVALLERAWALRRSFSIYDASYVALAALFDVPFVTTDKRLARGARATGLRAWNVEGPEVSRLLDVLEPVDE